MFKSCDLLCWFFFFFWHYLRFKEFNPAPELTSRLNYIMHNETKQKRNVAFDTFLKKKKKIPNQQKNPFMILFCTIRIWMNLCGVNLDVLLCSNQACLPAVSKYTLASQQYSLVVNYLMYSRNERTTGSVGRHAYRVTHAFTFLHYYTQSLNWTFFIFPHRERVHKL